MVELEPIWRADIQQRVFRELLEAFARPGQVRDLTPWLGETSAIRAALATLLDGAVTLADPHDLLTTRDWSLLQARRSTPEEARYVVADGGRAPDFTPNLGTLESPEFGATLLLQVQAVDSGPGLSLTGPGIKNPASLCCLGLNPGWLDKRIYWTAHFPLGVDMLIADHARIVALPRTTQIMSASADHGAGKQ